MQSSLTSRIVLLDSLINAALAHLARKHPEFRLSQIHVVLRQMLYQFYWQTRFSLFSHKNPWDASSQISHKALAAKVGLGREWVSRLLTRLKRIGWIASVAPMLPTGRRAVSVFSPGSTLRQLLSKLFHAKTLEKPHVTLQSQVFPSPQTEVKKQTDRQTDGLSVGDLVARVVKNVDLNHKIRW